MYFCTFSVPHKHLLVVLELFLYFLPHLFGGRLGEIRGNWGERGKWEWGQFWGKVGGFGKDLVAVPQMAFSWRKRFWQILHSVPAFASGHLWSVLSDPGRTGSTLKVQLVNSPSSCGVNSSTIQESHSEDPQSWPPQEAWPMKPSQSARWQQQLEGPRNQHCGGRQVSSPDWPQSPAPGKMWRGEKGMLKGVQKGKKKGK